MPPPQENLTPDTRVLMRYVYDAKRLIQTPSGECEANWRKAKDWMSDNKNSYYLCRGVPTYLEYMLYEKEKHSMLNR